MLLDLGDEELLREGVEGVDGLLGVTLPGFVLCVDELLGVTVGRGAGAGAGVEGLEGVAGVTVFLRVVVVAGEEKFHCDVVGFAGVVGVDGLAGVAGVTVFLCDVVGVVNVVELLYFGVAGFVFVVVELFVVVVVPLFLGVVK